MFNFLRLGLRQKRDIRGSYLTLIDISLVTSLKIIIYSFLNSKVITSTLASKLTFHLYVWPIIILKCDLYSLKRWSKYVTTVRCFLFFWHRFCSLDSPLWSFNDWHLHCSLYTSGRRKNWIMTLYKSNPSPDSMQEELSLDSINKDAGRTNRAKYYFFIIHTPFSSLAFKQIGRLVLTCFSKIE